MSSPHPHRQSGQPWAGQRLVAVDAIGTGVFAASAVVEAVVLGWTRPVGVAVALVLFAAGCVLFLAGYARAIDRSRTEELSIAGLYLLTGDVAPRPTKIRLLGLLAVQTVVALGTASVRPYTTVAFGVLAPMFGLGVNGRWAAAYGTFPPRTVLAPKRRKTARNGRAP